MKSLSVFFITMILSTTAASQNIDQTAQEIGRFCGITSIIDARLLPTRIFLAFEDIKSGRLDKQARTTGILRLVAGKTLDVKLHPTLKIRSNISNEIYTFETDFCGIASLAADPAVRSLEVGRPVVLYCCPVLQAIYLSRSNSI